MPKKKTSGLPYFAGRRGENRVRLYAHTKTATLFLEFKDEEGKKRRVSVGSRDLEVGKQAADNLAAQLRASEQPIERSVTLKSLFDGYEREVTPTKGPSKQAHDRRARALFERCWGVDAKVKDLDRRDWDTFIRQRRSGSLKPAKSSFDRGAGDRVIEYDLKFLLAVCNWAELVKEKGRPLLDRNPFKGYPLPVEASPSRPTLSEEEFKQLLTVAPQVGELCPFFLLLCHETGHRRTAIGRLRWSDIDLRSALVTWRAEFDKMGRRHTTPLSAEAAEALRGIRRAQPTVGDGWVFPSPTDSSKPVSQHLLRDWWERLEKLAGLKAVRGRGWHSLRRKFATEHQDLPPVELMALGGWKDFQTILKCYQTPREESLRAALERRSRIRSADGKGTQS